MNNETRGLVNKAVMSKEKNQEIVAVLNGELFDLLEQKYGSPPYTKKQIRNSVSFSREDLIEYVKKYGFPQSSYTKGNSARDGVHLDKVGSTWKIWHSERGSTCLHFESNDSELIQAALAELLVYLSGLLGGIDFTNSFSPKSLQW